MRSIALFAVVLYALSVGMACSSGGGPPEPDVLRLYAEPALLERAQMLAADTLRPQNITVQPVDAPATADISISSEPGDDESKFTGGYWVPVVQLPATADGLSKEQLEAAVSGSLDTWSDIDGTSTPLRIVVPSDRPPPIEQWFPDATPQVDSLPLDELPGALFADPGTLALVPLDAVNAGMRSLDVDGANIVFGTGDLSTYPLTETRWVSWSAENIPGFAGSTLSEISDAFTAQLNVAAPAPIIMRATGDIIPARCALAKIEAFGDHTHPYLELGPWLREANIAVGSLDSSMADISPPWPCQETFNLAAPSAAIEGLTFSGFDLVTNATNHALDCGQVGSCGSDAMLATNENLRAAGIEVVGSGVSLADARRPVILAVSGVRFAFLGYDDIAPYYHADASSAGTAPLDEAYVREDVANAKRQADVVVVMPHWGVEYQAEPTEFQQSIAQAAVDAGADVVLGNHPHWVEAAQVIGDSFVAYALGNFVFDQDWSLETQQGAVIELAFHPNANGGARLRGVRYHPIHIYDEQQPRFAEGDEAQQIMDRIWDASATLN